MKDYYKILNVELEATKEAIQNAFKALVLELHPDKNQGGTEESNAKLRDVFEAKKVLLNDKERKQYDQEYARENFSSGFSQQGLDSKKEMLAGLSDNEFAKFQENMVLSILKDPKSADKEAIAAFESVKSLREDTEKLVGEYEDNGPEETKELLDGYSEKELEMMQTILSKKFDEAIKNLDKNSPDYKALTESFSEDKANINKLITDKKTELRGEEPQREFTSPRPR